MEKVKLNTIEEAVEDFKAGNFVIIVDDEDRENEGDLIIAAEKITPEKVNFMLKHARGVLCAPITISRCKELDLPHQVADNTSVLGTPFTVTIDKLEGCTTGVSAADRAATIQALADPTSTPATFGRPGHINPLYAQEKGVLRRAGHTEATIDMCRLAGLYPAGALMEVMSDDGTMARLPELRLVRLLPYPMALCHPGAGALRRIEEGHTLILSGFPEGDGRLTRSACVQVNRWVLALCGQHADSPAEALHEAKPTEDDPGAIFL